MTKTQIDAFKSVLRLVRFLAWYAILVAAVLYLLPLAGQWLQGLYESMSIGARAFSVLGFLAVAAAGQLIGTRGRLKQVRGFGRNRQTDSA